MKYSDKARAVEARLSELPDDLRDRFKHEAVSNPGRVEEIAADLLAEGQKRRRPFDDKHLDDLYQGLGAVGSEAQAEFRRVIGFLGTEVDPDKVAARIITESTRYKGELEAARIMKYQGDVPQFEWDSQRYNGKSELEAAVLRYFLNAGSGLGLVHYKNRQAAQAVLARAMGFSRLDRDMPADPKAELGFMGWCPRCDRPRSSTLAACPTCGNTDPVPKPAKPP